MVLTERSLRSFAYNWGVSSVEFGSEKSRNLGRILKRIAAKKIFFVTDRGIVKAGILERISASLATGGFEVDIYDKVKPNPLDTIVEDGAKLAKKIKPEVIVGVGGGSSMDTAKAIALLLTNPGNIRNYEVRSPQDLGKIKNNPVPLITIPTTSGSGSEGNFWAIVTHTERWNKMSIGGPPTYPGGPTLAAKLAIDDPNLTLSLPAKQTASTGIDAFAHAYEAYIANVANPISDALAEYAMKVIAECLPIAYTNGQDVEAREKMMLASLLAGIAFANSDVAGVHCLGEALGGIYGNPPKPVVPHGLACSLFLPWMAKYNCMTDPVKHSKVAQFLGENVDNLSITQAALKSVDAIKGLIGSIGLASSLKTLNVAEKDLPAIAERASWNVSLHSNPRPLNYDVFLSIIENAYEG